MAEMQTIAVPQTLRPNVTGRWHYVALAAIVLLGAGLRFFWLDRPTLWGDEAATWARTCGTFDQMLRGNQQDGFVPLHYELYWAINHYWPMTAWRMRLVPALAGALMVPAMYFLARQLVRPRGALLVALLTATSAFFLNYSRDAKMYMPAWLFATLHIACVLWWLRGGGGVAWWCWVAAGVAAVGYHASAWLVVPMGLLAVLTHGRPRLWRLLLFPAGIAIMAAGPLYYYQHYNTWLERTGEVKSESRLGAFSGHWSMSGIAWIETQTRGKTGPELVRDSASAYLFGYSRAEEEADSDGVVPIPLHVLHLAWGTLAAFVLVCVVGAVRWPRQQPDAHASPWHSWQLMLWLSVWIVLPAYAVFYCRSMEQPTSPLQWLQGAWGHLGWHWAWIGLGAVAIGWIASGRRMLSLTVACLLAIAMAAIVVTSILALKTQWYLGLAYFAGKPATLGVLLVLTAGVSWASSGSSTRQRVLRLLAGIVVVVVVLGLTQVGWQVWEHLRRDAQQDGRQLYSIWMPRYLAVVAPAVLIVLSIAVLRMPGRLLPTLAIVIIVSANLAQYAARIYMDPEPRVDLLAQDLVEGDRDDAVAVYVRDRAMIGSPGSSGAYDAVTRFYIAAAMGPGSYNPLQMRMGPTDPMLKGGIPRLNSARALLNDLRQKPGVRKLVLWQRVDMIRSDENDAIRAGLGAEWELVGTWTHQAWRHWNWQEMDGLVRIEYRRADPAAREPAARVQDGSPSAALAGAARP